MTYVEEFAEQGVNEESRTFVNTEAWNGEIEAAEAIQSTCPNFKTMLQQTVWKKLRAKGGILICQSTHRLSARVSSFTLQEGGYGTQAAISLARKLRLGSDPDKRSCRISNPGGGSQGSEGVGSPGLHNGIRQMECQRILSFRTET